MVCRARPESRFHILSVPSLPAETARSLSGITATSLTSVRLAAKGEPDNAVLKLTPDRVVSCRQCCQHRLPHASHALKADVPGRSDHRGLLEFRGGDGFTQRAEFVETVLEVLRQRRNVEEPSGYDRGILQDSEQFVERYFIRT